MRKNKFRLLAVLLLVGIGLLAIQPAEAYTVAPSSGQINPCNGWTLNNYLANNVVQLCYSNNEALSLYTFPSYAADVVLQVARAKGMDIQRSKGSIEGEIRAHAYAWMGGERIHSNPMDIEMYSAPYWSYLLD